MDSGLIDSNGQEIKQGDTIRWWDLEYWEQRSFPEYVDCKGLTLKEHTATVLFEQGMFCYKDGGDFLPIAWVMPGFRDYNLIRDDDGYWYEGDYSRGIDGEDVENKLNRIEVIQAEA